MKRRFTQTRSLWFDKAIAAGLHFAGSLFIALLAAVLVLGVWFPGPYGEISGGRELFVLLVSVDVILGPLITFTVFNRTKPYAELKRDLISVVVLQLGALGYGLWTASLARPVHLVFEIDRFRVVHAVDIEPKLVPKTPLGIDVFPMVGPTLLAVRPFKDANEKMEATFAALHGVELATRPDLWKTYAAAKPEILGAVKPVLSLKPRFMDRAKDIDQVLLAVGRTAENTVYLPMVDRNVFWTVFLDPVTADVVAYLNLDSF